MRVYFVPLSDRGGELSPIWNPYESPVTVTPNYQLFPQIYNHYELVHPLTTLDGRRYFWCKHLFRWKVLVFFGGGSSPEMKKDYHLSFGQNYLNFLTATSERPSPPTVPRTLFCSLAGLVPEMQCKYVATSMQIASFLWSPLRQWHHLLLCHKITAEGGEHNAALSLSRLRSQPGPTIYLPALRHHNFT